jgi:hypothetical protein
MRASYVEHATARTNEILDIAEPFPIRVDVGTLRDQ